jgi:porin
MRVWVGSIAAIGIFGVSAAAWGQTAGAADSPYLLGDWGGQRQKLHDAGIEVQVQEQSEVWANLTGGLKQGATYDGLLTASVRLDLERLVGWTGGAFYASANQIHGRGPSANLVGNQQLVSSLEATRDTKLYDLWIEQRFSGDRVNLRVGQEGANDEFMISQYATLFENSSFGFPALSAIDLPSGGPNYPLATPFARLKYNVGGQFSLLGAVYNGDPAPPGLGDPQLRDAGGTAFRLNDHTLWVTEAEYSTGQGKGELPGIYKLGAWYSTSPFADRRFDTAGLPLASPASTGIPRSHSPGYGIYGIVDQMIWQPADAKGGDDTRGLAVFGEVMAAPGSFNLCDLSVYGGLNWKGIFPGRADDVAGLAVSYVGLSAAAQAYGTDLIAFTGRGQPFASSETVIEATYSYKATGWLTLQPDAQYVLNPNAGMPVGGRVLKDAVVIGTRATVTF